MTLAPQKTAAGYPADAQLRSIAEVAQNIGDSLADVGLHCIELIGSAVPIDAVGDLRKRLLSLEFEARQTVTQFRRRLGRDAS